MGTANLVLLYDGATVSRGNETVWSRRSTDGGATWSARQALSTSGEMGDFPSVESAGSGDVRAWYMQTNGGNFDAWNVWYRSSTDGGATWAAPVEDLRRHERARRTRPRTGSSSPTATTARRRSRPPARRRDLGRRQLYTGPGGGVWVEPASQT